MEARKGRGEKQRKRTHNVGGGEARVRFGEKKALTNQSTGGVRKNNRRSRYAVVEKSTRGKTIPHRGGGGELKEKTRVQTEYVRIIIRGTR